MYTETLTNYHKFYLAQEINVLTQSEIIKQPEAKKKEIVIHLENCQSTIVNLW